MSRSSLWKVYRTCATHDAEFRNSYQSAWGLWDYLFKTYLGSGYPVITSSDLRALDPLWKLARAERVPFEVRLVHAFTFDFAWCPLARLPELAKACKAVGTILPDSHWPAIAAELLRIHANHHRLLLGVGFGVTSVSDPWWNWKPGKEFDVFDIVEDRGNITFFGEAPRKVKPLRKEGNPKPTE